MGTLVQRKMSLKGRSCGGVNLRMDGTETRSEQDVGEGTGTNPTLAPKTRKDGAPAVFQRIAVERLKPAMIFSDLCTG